MRDARSVQLVQCASHLQEDGSQVLLVLPLRLVEEVDQLDTADDLHDKEADIPCLPISLGPSRILHEFTILGDLWKIEALDDCHLSESGFDESGFVCWVWFEDLHGIFDPALLNELDDRVTTLTECA